VISPAATKLRCLGIWQAPIAQQFRPWCFPVLGPHPKQRDTVVNFSVLPQPSAALPAAPSLQPPEEPGAAIRRIPKLPRDHAGAVPVRIHVSAAIPQIDMPAEAIDRLAAHAAGSPTFGVCAFARAQEAFDMWSAVHACRCHRAAKSSRWVLRSDRRGSGGHANTSLPLAAALAARKGGQVPKATADGKVLGNALL
jgi:hypothetical protein